MHELTGQVQAQAFADAASQFDARDSLMAEVDFKWLMAGQGRWIDTVRLHRDPPYAAVLIRWALESPSFALRECAALLQAQLGGLARCDAGESDITGHAA